MTKGKGVNWEKIGPELYKHLEETRYALASVLNEMDRHGSWENKKLQAAEATLNKVCDLLYSNTTQEPKP